MKEMENSTPEYQVRTSCRSCGGSDMADIMSLGDIGVIGFQSIEKKAIKVPLTLCFCENCSLLQLRHTTRPELLWGEQYWYRSGVNQTMRDELADIARSALSFVPIEKGDIMLDIGCNDGTLLDNYPHDVRLVGFDPSRNIAGLAAQKFVQDRGVANFNIFFDYFRKEPFIHHFGERKAKVVTAIAMFYDLDQPHRFLEDVKAILHPNGVFVVQQNYLAEMLKNNAFDNICHEHVGYYSLTTLLPMFERHGFEIFDVTTNDINGGSFRVYARHQGAKGVGMEVSPKVRAMLESEKEQSLTKRETYEAFAGRIINNGWQLVSFLKKAKESGMKIYILGASTRGNTLLQYYGIDNKIITAASERNSDKWGLVMAGTGIPIVSEDQARASNPDYFLVLPWHFRPEIIRREQKYLRNGGALVFPLPQFRVVRFTGDDEK